MEELHHYRDNAEEAYDNFLNEVSKLVAIGSSHPELDIDRENNYNGIALDLDQDNLETRLFNQISEAEDARVKTNDELCRLDVELEKYQNNIGPNESVSKEYDFLKEKKRKLQEDKRDLVEDLAEIRMEIHEELEHNNISPYDSAVEETRNATY